MLRLLGRIISGQEAQGCNLPSGYTGSYVLSVRVEPSSQPGYQDVDCVASYPWITCNAYNANVILKLGNENY